jgi:hypothetical protein
LIFLEVEFLDDESINKDRSLEVSIFLKDSYDGMDEKYFGSTRIYDVDEFRNKHIQKNYIINNENGEKVAEVSLEISLELKSDIIEEALPLLQFEKTNFNDDITYKKKEKTIVERPSMILFF